MRFSIILPTYNVSEFVRDAVFSVLNQVEVQSQFELIIVDDGSTDGTWEIVKNFSEYKNVKVYQIEHQGLGASRNFGLLKSNGDYILYLDGDDMIDVRLLGKLESHIVNQQPDMIIFSWQRMNILGNIDSPIYGGGSIEDMWPACWNKCYRRKILSNISFPEGVVYEDVGYAIAARLSSYSCLYEQDAIYYHRNRPEGISRRDQTLNERLDIFVGLKAVLERTDDVTIRQVALRITLQHLNRAICRRETITMLDLERIQTFFSEYKLFKATVPSGELRIDYYFCLFIALKFHSIYVVYVFLKAKSILQKRSWMKFY